MDKQHNLIDADKAIKMIDEAIAESQKEFYESEWKRGEMNGLGVAKDIILSGQCAPDPIPLSAIKLYKCSECNKISSADAWNKATEIHFGDDIAQIEEMGAKDAEFTCPKCGINQDYHYLVEVISHD